MSSQLDPGQIIKQAYDEVNEAHQVSIVAGTITLTEQATVANGGALPSEVKVVAGYDGSNVHVLKTNSSGELQVDVLSSVLPTGAATETTLASIDSKITAVDTDNVTIINAAGASAVNIQDGGNSITVDASNLDIRDLSSASDSVSAVITSSVLPTGAATDANQATEIASLASIDTKTPSLGQALAAASVPVVLTAAQITTLTPLSSITVTQATGTNLHTVVDASALPSGAATESTLSTISTNIISKLSGSLVPFAFDEQAITYVASGNGVGQIETVIFKLASSTVATLTLSYDSSNRLNGVVKT